MLIFDEKTHTYTLDGVVLPSVSQIIRGDEKMFCRPSDLERGRIVHAACALGTELDLDTVDERVKGYHDAYMSFVRDTEWIKMFGERPIASAAFGFAGTPDMVGHFNDPLKVCVVDIKTGKTLDKHHVRMQTAAYQILLSHAMPELEIYKRYALLLMESGKYKLSECVGGWCEFSALLQAHNERVKSNA